MRTIEIRKADAFAHPPLGEWAQSIVRGLALTGALGLAALPASAAVGEYWEITSKMEMAGMPFAMPANTVKVCLPKGNERDPRYSADKDCVVSDVQHSGNKTSWKIQCNTKDGVMTGVGESYGTPDSAEGKMRMTGTSGGQKIDMTSTYKNKRVGGTCDPDEMKKVVKEAQAVADKNMARLCDTSGYKPEQWLGSANRFLGDKPTCAGKKEALCAVVRRDVMGSPGNYALYSRLDQAGIAAACGLSVEGIKRSVCSSLDVGNAGIRSQLESRDTYRVMQAECPGEMKTYAEASRKRYCEGRDFTARKQMSLEQCLRSTGESNEMAEEEVAPLPNATAPKKTVGKGGQSSASSGAATPPGNAPGNVAGNAPNSVPGSAAEAGSESSAASAGNGNNPAGQATPSSNPLGLPDLPPNMNPAGAILDGAKKLKGLFGF